MAEFLNQQVKKVVKAKRNYKRYLALLLCLSMLVGLGTVAALTQKGEALTHKKRVLDCSFTPVTGEGYAGYVAHVHNDDCYDAKGQLLCTLPEIPAHYHTDACWETVKEIGCGLEESAGHVHTENCYARGEDLICGLAETEGHAHSDDCYAWYTDLTCGQAEYPEHWHNDDCYSWTTEQTCGLEEGEEHTHDENCYSPVRGELICGQTEGAGHAHDESCYGLVRGELICGLAEVEPHTHTAACHPLTDELICGLEEGAGAHTHEESCWHEVKKAICGYEGIHIHNESCYDAAGNLACGQKQLEVHVHGENCFKMVDMTPEEIAALGEQEQYDVSSEAYTWVAAGDPNANVETWNDWNNMFLGMELSGNWSEDLLAVARTQLGYGESKDNYALSSTGGVKGYTRYGDWYGIPYGDWCAMFVSFCIRWAGIPEENMPVDCNCSHWINQLGALGMYASAENYVPKPGDLVFFDFNYDGIADHVGIVAAADLENDALVTIEGNRTDFVETFSLRYSEACVMGYGLLPVNPNPNNEPVSLMPAQHFEDTVGDVTVTVEAPEGAFPADTYMILTAVEDEDILAAAAAAVVEGEEIETDDNTNRTTTYKKDVKQIRAVDITFYDVNGNEIQPLIPISVNMTGDFLDEVQSADIIHMENNSAEPVENAEKEENDVSFAADSFSTYVVVGSDKIATEFTLKNTSREDVTFVVSATFGTDAKIPDGAWLSVTEYAEDSYGYSQAKETVINAKKAENEAYDDSQLELAALDISLMDMFGYPIEPAMGSEVKISLEMKKLPETATQDVLSKSIEIQHLDTSAGYTQVKTVAGKDNIAFADGGIKAAFTVESFSTFTLTWQNGQATIHYGTLNTETHAFEEFSDEHLALLDTSAASVSLANNFDGYSFIGASYKANASAEEVDIVEATLTRTENGWTANVQRYDDPETPTTETVTIANGSHIYAYYAQPSEHGGTPVGVDIPKPDTQKTVTVNNDKTATITLDITGRGVTETQQTGANVLVVFDRTQSMSNRMGSKTRLQVAKEAVAALVDALDCDTNDIQLAFVPFASTGSQTQFGDSYWTSSGDTFVSTVNATGQQTGTNWESGLYYGLQTLNSRDDDNTYVIFLTDGEPNRRGTTSAQSANTATAISYALEQARAITALDNVSLYGIFCGSDSGYNNLANMITNAGGVSTINGTNEEAIHDAFASIAQTIINNLGASGVSVDDGVTQLSSVSAQVSGTAGGYQYLKKAAGAEEFTTWDGAPGASFSDDNGVTWDLSAAGTLEKDTVYRLQFTVWPSQEAYDLLADFNNNAQKLTAQIADVKSQFTVTIGGTTYEYSKDNGTWTNGTTDAQLQALIDANPSAATYELKTNTHLNTTYTFKNNTYTDSYPAGTGSVEVESSQMSIQKVFAHSINDVSPFAKLTFYLMRDGKYYMTDGSLTDTAPTEGATGYYSIDLPTGNNPNDPANWRGSVFIAPGVMKDGEVLETGHKYSLTEIITSGDVYEYEFQPQTVRPMVINGTLTFLVLKDSYYTNPGGAQEYTIDGETYYVGPSNGEMIGTNAKTAELDITKLVVDNTGRLTEEQLNDETFTYRVTLTVPAGGNVTGITAYEYVPRYDEAPASDRYTIFGYRSVDDPSTLGIDTDVSRFQDKIYGGYTVTYPHEQGEPATLERAFVTNPDGSQTATIDITMKRREILRFTNLPSGTQYTIQEVYANLRTSNPSRDTDAPPSYGVPSNLTEQGYTVSSIYKNGTRSASGGSVVSGTITDLDVRYYNQFTNTLSKAVDAEIGVTKHLLGYQWSGERYYYVLEAANGAPMPNTTTRYLTAASGTDDVSYIFGKVRFTDAGTYTYTLTERPKEYYTGATSQYLRDAVHGYGTVATITVTVAYDDDNELTVTSVTMTKEGEAQVETTFENGLINTTFTNWVTAKVNLLKIANDDRNKPLADVEFKLYSDVAGTQQIKTDATGAAIGDADGVIKTGTDGKAEIGSLIPGTYYLKEVTPPDGYAQLNEVITITVNTDGTVTYDQPSYQKSQNPGADYDADQKVYTLIINNTSGSVLPKTGGMGVTPFTVGGLALTLCALALLLEVRRRQRRRGDANP